MAYEDKIQEDYDLLIVSACFFIFGFVLFVLVRAFS